MSRENETNTDETATDLEEALDKAGAGKYQLFHCTLMWATLAASLLELIGYQFILPAAACDLELPETLRGIVASIPNIGIILTAPFWGRAADSLGRKPTLLVSTGAAGIIGVIAAFMPNLLSFAICKTICALFLSCPTSLGYAYAGEMTPRRRRDLAVLMCNAFLTLSSVLNPLLAWGVLSNDWHYELGYLTMRPWRLLTIVYSTPMIFAALWMTQAKESPKYLMAKGRSQETLEVLKHIYSRNTGLSPKNYSVTSLKSKENLREVEEYAAEAPLTRKVQSESVLALVRPPHLKWFTLTAFLMFGLYTLLNGLFMFATDTLNKVLRESSDEEGTLCVLINQPANQTTTSTCNDNISQDTFLIMVVSTLAYAVIVVLASMSPLSKKTLLISMYIASGAATLLSGLLTNRVVAGVAMSAMQLNSLGIGLITAYTVQLFPTSLRGTAVGAVLMFGRLGAVTGATVAGYLLAVACTATFYGFAALVFLCAGLSFLLPKDQAGSSSHDNVDTERDNR